MRQIIFLGTGNGSPIQSGTTCMLLETDQTNMLLDVGGGHELLNKFREAGRDPTTIENILITHYDSDHLLGLFPLMRIFRRMAAPSSPVNIYCSEHVRGAITSLFSVVSNTHYEAARENFRIQVVEDGTHVDRDGLRMRFFDVKSPASPQLGCAISFPDGTRLAYLGDEPFREHYYNLVKNSDVVIHEAICLESEKEVFDPYSRNHGTVKEAAINAARIGAKRLVLFHMEDRTLATRKSRYLSEASTHFEGEVFVPVDLDVLTF